MLDQMRNIQKVWTVQQQRVSPIHAAAPVLAPGNWQEYDPFLLMMEDKFGKDAFDIHPHRGIETLTYIIDGRLEHYDNATGEGGLLEKGDVQLMTAGRGVLHLESPPEGEYVHSLQLWINLPHKYKMVNPRYQNLKAEEVPVRMEEGASIRVYSGSSGNVQSGTLNYAPFTFVEISLDSGASVIQDLPANYSGFVYVLEGSGTFGENKVEAQKGQAMQLGHVSEGEKSGIEATANEKLKFVLLAGEPIREPIVARGPFVMNTEEEIRQAYQDYQEGKFSNP